MCGIGAIINLPGAKKEDIINAVTNMAISLSERGEDATGIAFIKDNSYEILKKPLRAEVFVETDEYKDKINEWWDSKVIMIHARNATRGEPSNNYNNHPIESENFVVIHNGTITNESLENFLNNLRKWDERIETDTYIINKMIEIAGIQSLPSIGGSIATIIYDKRNHKLVMFRNSETSPLKCGYSEDANMLMFASTEKAISEALEVKEMLFGLIEKVKSRKMVETTDIPRDIILQTGLNRISFEKVIGTNPMIYSEELEKYYAGKVMKINNKLLIHVSEEMNSKVLAELESVGFTKNKNNLYIINESDFSDFMNCIKKHKKQKNEWTQYYTRYYY